MSASSRESVSAAGEPFLDGPSKLLEKAVAVCDDDTTPHLWERIAEMVAAQENYEATQSLENLVGDGARGNPTFMPSPNFRASSCPSPICSAKRRMDPTAAKHCYPKERSRSIAQGSSSFNYLAGVNAFGRRLPFRSLDQEQRKGIPWSEEEHRLFLLGLEKFGKGDWRSISRSFVVSRTPTQVASHAQKYFIRQKSLNKEKRRTSIHDITHDVSNGSALRLSLHHMHSTPPQAMASLGVCGSSPRQTLLSTREDDSYTPFLISHMDRGAKPHGFWWINSKTSTPFSTKL